MDAVVQKTPESLLRQLVGERASASVLFTGAKHQLSARFEAVDATAVTLLLFEIPSARPTTGTVACVQYRYEGRNQVFMSSVLTMVDDADGSFLLLQRPDHLAQLDARRAFRVPLQPGDLPAEIVGPEGRCVGEVRDLSPIGVGIGVLEGALPEVGDSIRIRVTVDGRRRVLSGAVIQVHGPIVGIEFTADVPTRIGDLVRAAEARWRGRDSG
ncbi:MAG: PilZ domain-containing protein [Myxococcota bacterium]